MATENIKISSFDNVALRQLADYLGRNVAGITNEIVSASSRNKKNSDDDTESLNSELTTTEDKLKSINESLKLLENERKKALNDIEKYQTSTVRGSHKKLQTARAEYDELQKRIGVLKTESRLTKESIKNIKKRQKALENNKKTTTDIVTNEKDINKILSDRINLQQHLNKLQEDAYNYSRDAWIKKNPKPAQRFLNKQERIATETGKSNEYLEREKIINKLFGGDIHEHAALGHKNSIAQGIISGSLKGLGTGVTKAANFLSNDKQTSISDVGNTFSNIAGNFGPWGKAVGVIAQAVASIVEAYDKINKSASDYARSVGGGAVKMQQMKMDATMVAADISKWGAQAYKFDKILEHISELSSKTGRVMDHMSELDIKSLEDLTRYGITSDTLNVYDSFGLSIENIDKRITGVYNKAGRHGLNAKAVTDAVNKNLRMAQQYTFAGGQRALERMAEKAIALKYNMESVARFADKVSTLESAAQAGAGLSVLGGDFARMGNPLSLLYGGLQDPERLNEMMLNMTKNMAHWDSQLGEMRITAYNRQRLRAAAEYMGVDSNDLINQALMQGKRRRVDSQIGNGVTDEKTREYIRNLAQLDEKGQAYIRFSGESKNTYLSGLTESDKARLQKESEAMEQKDKAKIGDIWKETRTITEQLNDIIDVLKTRITQYLLKIVGYDTATVSAASKYGIYDLNEIDELKKGKRKYANKQAAKTASLGLVGGTLASGGNPVVGGVIGGLGYLGGYIEGNYNYNEDTAAKQMAINKERKRLEEQYPDNKVKVEKELKKYIDSIEKRAYGGIIHGAGTSTSDSIPAMLSDGEVVMNAKAAKKHLPELQAWNAEGFSGGSPGPIRAGANQTNSMTVSNPGGSGNNQSLGIDTLKLEPISINVNGTIKLDAGNSISRNVDAKEWLFNNNVISQLMREISVAANRTLDKTLSDLHQKYPMSQRQIGMG